MKTQSTFGTSFEHLQAIEVGGARGEEPRPDHFCHGATTVVSFDEFARADTMTRHDHETIADVIARGLGMMVTGKEHYEASGEAGIHFWNTALWSGLPQDETFGQLLSEEGLSSEKFAKEESVEAAFKELCRSAFLSGRDISRNRSPEEGGAPREVSPRVRVNLMDGRAGFGIGTREAYMPIVQYEFDQDTGYHVMTSVMPVSRALLYVLGS